MPLRQSENQVGAGMTKASGTEAETYDNTNRSRAAQAAESGGGTIKLSFGRLAPPRFCFGNSIVMPDLIRHPVNLALRFTQGHSEPFASLKDRRSEESQFNIKSKIYNACAAHPSRPRLDAAEAAE